MRRLGTHLARRSPHRSTRAPGCHPPGRAQFRTVVGFTLFEKLLEFLLLPSNALHGGHLSCYPLQGGTSGPVSNDRFGPEANIGQRLAYSSLANPPCWATLA